MTIKTINLNESFTGKAGEVRLPSIEREAPPQEDVSDLSGNRHSGRSFSYTSIKSSLGAGRERNGAENQDSELKPLEDNIKMLESVRQLQEMVGNHAKARELADVIARKKKELQQLKSAPPPPRISPEVKEEIAAYIQGRGDMPESLSCDQKENLEHLKSLVVNGMSFTSPEWKEIAPEEAFTKLIETKYIDHQNNVLYKTFEDNNIVLATLRPQYLNPLDHFIKYSKKGYVFYDKTSAGPVQVKTAREFIERFRDNPDKALVKTLLGEFVTVEEAEKMKAQEDLNGLISGVSGGADKPDIIEEDDMVIIGGVMLRKKKE